MTIVPYIPDQAVAYSAIFARESGARLYFYAYETTNPVAIYQDPDGTPSPNPLLSLADGSWPQVYWDNAIRTRVVKLSPVGAANPATWQVDDIGPTGGLSTDLSNVDATPEQGAAFLDAISANAENIRYTAPNGDDITVASIFDGFVTPQMFGYTEASSPAETVDAFNAMCDYIVDQGGGKIIVPPGNYIWGKQDFAGADNLGYAYRGYSLFSLIDCEGPISIDVGGCTFTTAPTMRFGSFNPVTGAVYNPPGMPFVDVDYRGDVGVVFDIIRCDAVEITGPALCEGNIANMVLGGTWGDTGRQLLHTAVRAYGNENLAIDGIDAFRFGLDGFSIGWDGLLATANLYPHRISNCRALYNCRQGFSWVGGNNLELTNCDGSHTGKGTFASSPGAGLDVEAENAICTGLVATNCRFFDNAGVCIVSDSGTSYGNTLVNCQAIGTTQYAVWLNKPQWTLINCQIVGSCVNVLGNADPLLAAKDFGSTWSMDTADSPNGIIYGDQQDLTASENVLFEGSKFKAVGGTNKLPAAVATAIMSNVTAVQTTAQAGTFRGKFQGLCTITTAGVNDFGASKFYGYIFYNGVQRYAEPFSTRWLTIQANNSAFFVPTRWASYYSPTVWAAQTEVGGPLEGDWVRNTNVQSGQPVSWTYDLGTTSWLVDATRP